MLLASLWATGVGVIVVMAGWHRPSDAIGSDLIVVIYAALAITILARLGQVHEATARSPFERVARGLLVAIFGAVVLAAMGVGVVVASDVLDDLAATRAGTPSAAAFVAGCAIVLAGGAMVSLTLLTLLRRAELVAPPSALTEEPT